MTNATDPVPPPRRPLRNLLINLGLFSGVSLLVLCAFEVAVRLTEPRAAYDQRDNEFVFYEYDETLGWRNRPGASGTFYMPDSKSEVRINSAGLRDVEHELEKEGGVRRVQFYGDSFTWGYGVDADERITEVFGRELERTGGRFEVMNFGTTGYGTDQEYLLMKKAGLGYDPDLVVFMYHNDVGDVGRKVAYTYPRPYFELEDGELRLRNVPVPKRDLEWTERFGLRKEGLVHAINRTLKGSSAWAFTKRRLLRIDAVRDRVYAQPAYAATLQVIDRILLAAAADAREAGAGFCVVLIPDKSQVHGPSNTIEIDHLVELGADRGIHVVNLLPDLRRLAREGEELYFAIDGHFSPRGNELVGKLLFERLLDAGLIEGRG